VVLGAFRQSKAGRSRQIPSPAPLPPRHRRHFREDCGALVGIGLFLHSLVVAPPPRRHHHHHSHEVLDPLASAQQVCPPFPSLPCLPSRTWQALTMLCFLFCSTPKRHRLRGSDPPVFRLGRVAVHLFPGRRSIAAASPRRGVSETSISTLCRGCFFRGSTTTPSSTRLPNNDDDDDDHHHHHPHIFFTTKRWVREPAAVLCTAIIVAAASNAPHRRPPTPAVRKHGTDQPVWHALAPPC
jgi:hypothetical protein